MKDEILCLWLWKLKKVTVVPIIVGALGSVTTNFERSG